MDAVRNFAQMEFRMEDVLKGSAISNVHVAKHLRTVYLLVAAAAIAATAGSVVCLAVPMAMSMMSGFLGRIVLMGATFAILAAMNSATGTTKAMWFMGFSAVVGASLAPLINLAMVVDPTIIVTAALLTAVVFATFSAIATLSPNRSLLYIGGTLSSVLGWLAIASLINIFVRSPLLLRAEVFIGLFVFCGFVAFDTQLLLARATDKVSSGVRLTIDDAVHAAVHLFMDLVNLFVRILIILLQNSKKEKKERR